jgi:hypothetical protein
MRPAIHTRRCLRATRTTSLRSSPYGHWGAARIIAAVRRKRNCRSVGFAVLHQCIRPQIGAFAPGHHGYQRACVLITGQASRGPLGSPGFACAGKTGPPSRLILSQTSAGNRTMSSRSPCRSSSFVRAVGRSFVPACTPCGASRAGVVKAGRRAAFAAGTNVSRPRLDGPEHGAMLTQPGTRAPLRLRRRVPC